MKTVICMLVSLGLAVLAGAVCLAAEPAFAVPYSAQQEREVRMQAAFSRDALGLQTELPIKPDSEPMRPSLPEQRVAPDLSGAAKVLLWVALIVGIIVIALNLRTNLWSFSRARRLEKEALRTPAVVTARMEKAREDASVLAAQGSYAEAMHVLLLQSVSELRLRLGFSIAASLTSREILHAIGLSAEQHVCFADIVRRVEFVYFGERQADREQYQQCLRSFEGLTAALHEGGAGNMAGAASGQRAEGAA